MRHTKVADSTIKSTYFSMSNRYSRAKLTCFEKLAQRCSTLMSSATSLLQHLFTPAIATFTTSSYSNIVRNKSAVTVKTIKSSQ